MAEFERACPRLTSLLLAPGTRNSRSWLLADWLSLPTDIHGTPWIWITSFAVQTARLGCRLSASTATAPFRSTKPSQEHEAFAQFASDQGWIDLDLMFVNESTFDRLWASSVVKSIGPVAVR